MIDRTARRASILERPWFEVVRRLIARHRLVLLVGEPGVGKTTFAFDAARRRTGRDPIVLAGSPETELPHIVGYRTLDGDGTRFEDGPLMRALKAGAWLLVEEFNLIPLEARMQFLHLRGAESLTNPVTGEVVPIPPEFRLIATGNPESLACRRNAGIARALFDDFLIFDVPPLESRDVEATLRFHFPRVGPERIARVLECWEDYRSIAAKSGEGEPEHLLSYRAAAHLLGLLEDGLAEDVAVRVALANKYMTDPDLYATAKLKSSLG